MDNNSWLALTEQDPAFMLPADLAQRDAFGARDCGWVEQMRPFIRAFSAPGDLVLDPFCGFGTTLVAAHLEGRRGIGLEIEPARVAIARERLASLKASVQHVFQGSLINQAPAMLKAQLALTNLPYFGCRWPQQENPDQLYNEESYAQFLDGIRQSFVALKSVIDDQGYVIVMAENLRAGSCFVPFAWDVARMLAERFVLLEERVLVYPKPLQAEAGTDVPADRAHEYALIARNTAKPIDMEETLHWLKKLAQDFPQFVVFGSFAKWLHGEDLPRPPSDADLLVPNEPEHLRKMVAWFEQHGFRMTRWGAPLHASLAPVAMEQAHYFRAERLRKDGRLCLIDLCFDDGLHRFDDAWSSAIQSNGLQILA